MFRSVTVIRAHTFYKLSDSESFARIMCVRHTHAFVFDEKRQNQFTKIDAWKAFHRTLSTVVTKKY